MDKIFISGLELTTLIGVYDWERIQNQPILLDIEVTVDTRKAGTTDLLKDTLDYDVLLARLSVWVGETRCALLEALAEHIADKLFQEFSIQGVRLRLSKPKVMPHVERVGVLVERGEI